MVAQDCARAYRSSSVLTASPGQLVLMLYDGALRAMAQARAALARPPEDRQRIQVVNKQIGKAQRIIRELDGGLNMEAGDGSFSREMRRLYQYYNRRLVEANLRKEAAPLVEVEQLFGQVRDAWAEMLRKQDPACQNVGSTA